MLNNGNNAKYSGYKEVTSPVIVFLDAHCEVVDGWLEPLLWRIHQNRSNVVCPEIDVISYENFGYSYASGIRGVFNWNLHFRWRAIPQVEQNRRKSVIDPIRFVYQLASISNTVDVRHRIQVITTTLAISQVVFNQTIYNDRSPTMAGGLFAIHKKYFEEIGLYDDEMDIWGGENLEISFRVRI